MLVISVIVALAILSVLLGFIGGVNIFGQNAKDAATTLINKVTTDPGITEIIDADFAAGNVLEAGTITAKTTLKASNLKIICAGGTNDNDFCGSGDNVQVKILNDQIAQNIGGSKIKVSLAACKRATKPQAILCISSLEQKTSLVTECLSKCGN